MFSDIIKNWFGSNFITFLSFFSVYPSNLIKLINHTFCCYTCFIFKTKYLIKFITNLKTTLIFYYITTIDEAPVLIKCHIFMHVFLCQWIHISNSNNLCVCEEICWKLCASGAFDMKHTHKKKQIIWQNNTFIHFLHRNNKNTWIMRWIVEWIIIFSASYINFDKMHTIIRTMWSVRLFVV